MSVESDVRDYLRGRPALMQLLNDDPKRMNVDWQGEMRATHVTFYVAGGGFHGFMPLRTPVFNFHCYGSTRPACATVAEQLALEIRALTEAARPLASGEVLSTLFVPTSDGIPRYVVTTAVTVKLGVAA